MRRAFDKIIDIYLEMALLIDFLVATLVWFCAYNFSFLDFIIKDKDNQISLLQELISTSVSLAGFILAALTIIVTFKSNLKAKSIENSDNALDLIFSTGHYDNIVRVFKSSIIELVFCFVALFIVWASTDNLDVIIINKVNVCAILLTSFAIVRSLMVLFMILSLDGLNKE